MNHIRKTTGEFSVCQFFSKKGAKAFDEIAPYEYVRRYVGVEEAMEAFQHYCTSVGARMGFVDRVIITDGGDCVNAEWKFGEGLVFPPQEKE